ncbi:MAG: hypothetical protein HW390_547 [Candidatus Brocadiaceae bacterium]|nr:hypothetical protein [Candidatus Brocadiaceae bacterium]
MSSLFLAVTRKRFGILGYGKVLFLFLLMSACFAPSLPADQVGQPSPVDNMDFPDSQGIRNGVMTSGDACHTREVFTSKTRTLQMPFIANNGQVAEQVRFYAKTFGGTVFVTKEGDIVYALPEGRDVPAGASPSQHAHGDALGSRGVEAQRRRGEKPCSGCTDKPRLSMRTLNV